MYAMKDIQVVKVFQTRKNLPNENTNDIERKSAASFQHAVDTPSGYILEENIDMVLVDFETNVVDNVDMVQVF